MTALYGSKENLGKEFTFSAPDGTAYTMTGAEAVEALKTLTEGQALLATQAAIWSASTGDGTDAERELIDGHQLVGFDMAAHKGSDKENAERNTLMVYTI